MDLVKSAIEKEEQSADLLSAADAHDSGTVSSILKRIEFAQKDTGVLLDGLSKSLDELKAYKMLEPPTNNEYLSEDNGLMGFPLSTLQSIEGISWSSPLKKISFPSGVQIKSGNKIRNKYVGVDGYEFTVRSLRGGDITERVNALLSDKKLFLTNVGMTTGGNGGLKTELKFMYFING